MSARYPMNRYFPIRSLRFAVAWLVTAVALRSDSILTQAAHTAPGEAVFQIAAQLPAPVLATPALGEVSLLPGLFHDRRELTKKYLLSLQTDNVLQDFILEAGGQIQKPYEEMHQGWEAPYSQVRGHFAGHWLSATAHFAALDQDPLMAVRAREVVLGLKRCQELNGGEWVGSIPEKYFTILAAGYQPIWSPQYTLHKTMMGLFDAYRYTHDEQALAVLERSADWFDAWTQKLVQDGHGEVVYRGEAGGMLELWADLYGATRDPRYLRLASRYAMPDMFRGLLAGGDPLTDQHSNASIPWVHGAARLYEVTGDPRYRRIVELFWNQAVEKRGMFATTGANAGEFWIPPQQFGRFLGARTQEHCTVYNMIRVAQYLLRWTGDTRYADYIERALYNGILAQQNPATGMVSYFLPLQPGAKKTWSSKTQDFWCCLGTMVQAQAMYEDLIYYGTADGVTVSQFIPSQAEIGAAGRRIHIRQEIDTSDAGTNFTRGDEVTHFVVNLTVSSDDAAPWTLRIRKPSWAGAAAVTVEGEPVSADVSRAGYLEIQRSWKGARVRVTFAKQLKREPLPGDSRWFALVDGPVVLAALTDKAPQLAPQGALTPQYEHLYADGREWQSGHFFARDQQGAALVVEPLYEVADENYCVYFPAVQ